MKTSFLILLCAMFHLNVAQADSTKTVKCQLKYIPNGYSSELKKDFVVKLTEPFGDGAKWGTTEYITPDGLYRVVMFGFQAGTRPRDNDRVEIKVEDRITRQSSSVNPLGFRLSENARKKQDVAHIFMSNELSAGGADFSKLFYLTVDCELK